MDWEGSRERIRNTVSLLKAKQIDYQAESQRLQKERDELKTELDELKKESQKIRDEKDSAEIALTEAEGAEALGEITSQISEFERRQEIIAKTLEQKSGEAGRLELEYSQLFVDSEYSKRLGELKNQRDTEYQKLIDAVDTLRNCFEELTELRLQSFKLQNRKNECLSKLEFPTESPKSWGITVEKHGNVTDLDWVSDFAGFLKRLSSIEENELPLML